MSDIATKLREVCQHDGHSVDEGVNCEASDEIEFLRHELAQAKAALLDIRLAATPGGNLNQDWVWQRAGTFEFEDPSKADPRYSEYVPGFPASGGAVDG